MKPDHPLRARGPSLVWAGKPDGPTVVVLDPAGAAMHAELPPTWRGIAEHRQILWCRLPSDGSLSEGFDMIADPDALGRPIDVVTSGPAAGAAMTLVGGCAGIVRSLLLVDPAAGAPGGPTEPAQAQRADALWADAARSRTHMLEASGITVRIVAHSHQGADDRVPPPLPLGHPDVTAALSGALAELDGAEHA